MFIQKISLTNFKSFEHIDIELDKLNVLIGANASGKTNFIQILQFLRDIANDGLNNAISMQGGVEFFRNTTIAATKDFSLEIVLVQDRDAGMVREKDNLLIGIQTTEIHYEFTLQFHKRGREFRISKDRMTLHCTFLEMEKDQDRIHHKGTLGTGTILLENAHGKLKPRLHVSEGVPIEEGDIFPRFLEGSEVAQKSLLIETPVLSFFLPFEKFFDDIAIYDFDPRLPKRAISITGKTELDEKGENLAIVLKNIIDDKEQERKLSNIIRDILPFIEKLEVERFADKSLLCTFREIYSSPQKLNLPASLMSDGTIHLIALIVALYFETKPLIVIEEPERNIHPFLISRLVDMLKESSSEKQIVVTTHNPEIVKYTDFADVLLISRDHQGFSTITHPIEKEDVHIFLEEEIGVNELYVQNML